MSESIPAFADFTARGAKKKVVYMDNAGTTPMAPEVLSAMLPFMLQDGLYGNPSTLHSVGREAARALQDARERMAAILRCKPNELYFTSGATEADNWAVKGVARARAEKRGRHLITSKIEHHAVFESMEALEKEGFEVTYLDVDQYGLVDPETLRKAMRPDTSLVAIIYANNEIGTVEPIAELARVAHEGGAYFFTDAVQAAGWLSLDVQALGADMLSMSAHKFHGPRGVGALYVKTGVRVANLVDGGGQERGRRSGTENVAGIVGMAAALQLSHARMGDAERIERMRDRLIDGLLQIPYTRLNGDRTRRLPGNVNISFQFIEGESLILRLDMLGFCASTGSACSSASLDPSHVLLAIGLPHEIAHGSLRLSLSHQNTDEEVDAALAAIPAVVQRLRDMSPLYEKITNNK